MTDWASMSPRERGDFIRRHIRLAPKLSSEAVRELFLLTEEGLEAIGNGADWQPEFQSHEAPESPLAREREGMTMGDDQGDNGIIWTIGVALGWLAAFAGLWLSGTLSFPDGWALLLGAAVGLVIGHAVCNWLRQMKTRPPLLELLRKSVAAYEAMSPADKASHDEAQRQSWIRGMAPCEHGARDWETCPECRTAARERE